MFFDFITVKLPDRSDAISFISYREMWQIAKGLSDGSPRDAQAEQDA